jgi:hypothetical protein
MPLDHYVSQVHLRNFYSPGTNRLHTIRKSDLKQFATRSKDVCRIENGSTNEYLLHDRAIEEFLSYIEPSYNTSVSKLRNRNIDTDVVFVLAGFAAYVASCSPTAMRLQSAMIKEAVTISSIIIDRQGKLGEPIAALGNRSMEELLSQGIVDIDIDQKYPQAIGISSILDRVSSFGNARWQILRSPGTESFFTSDFPTAIERRPDGVVNRIVPLAPDIAIRIIPDVHATRMKPDFAFPRFTYIDLTLNRSKTIDLNRVIVQSAESLVFHRDDKRWMKPFVSRYKTYRAETLTDRIPYGNGFLNLGRLCVVAH